jgi:predicted metal-dependent phosphoesterase TrpH
VAITDHNAIAAALAIKEQLADLGERIIIGEEVMTTEGEIIGLYLSEEIPGNCTPPEAMTAILEQGGLVYIPHPFETVREGIGPELLKAIAHDVDIIETYNGRAIFQNKSRAARQWAEEYDKPGAASSDALVRFGWGRTFSIIAEPPTRENLPAQLREATYATHSVGTGVLYPKFNRLTRRLRRAAR